MGADGSKEHPNTEGDEKKVLKEQRDEFAIACLKLENEIQKLQSEKSRLASEKKLTEKRFEQVQHFKMIADKDAEDAQVELKRMKEKLEKYGSEKEQLLKAHETDREHLVKAHDTEREQLEREYQKQLQDHQRHQQSKLNEEREELYSKKKELDDEIHRLTLEKERLQNEKAKQELTRKIKETERYERLLPLRPQKKNPYMRRFEAIKWTRQEEERLRNHCLLAAQQQDVVPFILIMGPTGHGKSTLFNGFWTALNDKPHVSQLSPTGSSLESFTKTFVPAKCGNIWMFDMAGLFESQHITDDNLRKLLCGKVPFRAQLSKHLEIKNKEALLKYEDNKIDLACVILVLRSQTELGPELKRQINVIHSLAGEGVLSCLLVITHLDKCDDKFDDPTNLPKLYSSPKVIQAIQRVHRDTQIAESSIHVVRNYVVDTEADLHTKIVHLHVLDNVISNAIDRMDRKQFEAELDSL